jgi:hypothetical protein
MAAGLGLINLQGGPLRDRAGRQQLETEPDRVDMHSGQAADDQMQRYHAAAISRVVHLFGDLLEQRLDDRHLVHASSFGPPNQALSQNGMPSPSALSRKRERELAESPRDQGLLF